MTKCKAKPRTVLLEKSRLLVLVSLLLFPNLFLKAQVPQCGTVITQAAIDFFEQNREMYERFELTPEMSRNVNRVPIQVHIMRRSNGSGGIDLQDIQDAVDRTNEFYRSANIEFFISDSPNYVDNDAYFNLVPPYESFINWSEHESPTKVNAFFFNRITYPGQPTDNGVGIGLFPNMGNAIYMQNEATVNLHSLLAHELGHYFNLFHTHETASGAELVTRGNGRNCENAGDLLCDTPADPYLPGKVDDCRYTGTDRDANGQLYDPLTNNIMSYSPYHCITTFTDDQRERIQATLAGPRSYLLGEESSLDCDAAIPISVGQFVTGTTIGMQNNQERYYVEGLSNPDLGEVYQGPEAIYKFNWPGGRIYLYLDIKLPSGQLSYPDLDMILLRDCQDSKSGIALGAIEQSSDPSTSFERMRPNLEPGTYYLVIDGYGGASGSFDLTFDNHGLDCSDIELLSLNEPYEGDTRDKQDRGFAYCTEDPAQKYSNPEAVHQIDWPGGNFTATLDITGVPFQGEELRYPDLDLILLSDCSDLTSCVDAKYGTGSQEKIEQPNLSPGIYYLVVDGKRSANVFNKGQYTLTVEKEDFSDYAVTFLETDRDPLISGQPFKMTYYIENLGTKKGGFYGVAQYLLDSNGVRRNLKEYFSGDPFSPGDTAGGEATRTIPEEIDPGTYYIVVAVKDEGGNDANSTNDTLTIQVRVEAPSSLDCANALPLQHVAKMQGNFTNAANNVTDYGRGGNFTGREVLYRIDLPSALWFQGNVYFDVTGDVEKVILLNSCDPIEVFAGPYIDKGIAKVLSGVSSGTYYVVVEGPLDGSDGNFEITVRRDHLGCSDAKPITIGQPTGPGTTAYDYVNHYCGNPNAAPLTGNEAVFEFNWPGGDFRATLSDMVRGNSGDAWEDAALILLTDCQDPATCVADPAINNGASELVLNVSDLPAGDYTIVVDGASPELSPEFTLTIIEEVQKPDYQPTAISGPGTASLGQNITMQVTLKNNGGDLGPNDDITNGKDKYYISDRSNLTAANLDAQATFLQAYDTDDIPSGETREYPGGVTIPASVTPGQYYIYFFHDADDTIDESDEDNNVISWPITIEGAAPKPDLTIESFSIDTDLIIPVEPFNVRYTHRNIGNADAPGNGVLYYLSTNSNLDQEEGAFWSISIDPLAADISGSGSHIMAIPQATSPGNYYIIMEIDGNNIVDESNENNNTYAIPVTVGDTQKPDYQPTNFRARGGATTLQAGGTIIIDLKIENNGPVDGLGNSGKDKYYLNTSPDLSGNPTFLRDFETADISANSNFDVNSGPLNIPANTAPGTYYIVFFHDADNKIDESDESNNIAYLQIEVVAPESGLDVDFIADQSSVCAGESVQFTSEVSVGSGSQEVVYDQSGNGNSGQLFNLDENSFIENAGYGKALVLTGNENYIELPENLTANLDNFTFEARFFYESHRNWQRLFDFGNGQDEFIILSPNNGEGKVDFIMKKGDTRKGFGIEEPLIPNQWYHFAITIDANKQAKLYINGELKKDEPMPLKMSDFGNLSNNWIGQSQYLAIDPYLKGKLDEVRIWSTARTQAEIEANKDRELTGNEDGLVVYYDFNQEVGNAASYDWQVEKPGTSTITSSDANPSFTFNEPGSYQVSLTVINDEQTASAVKNITVEDCMNNLTVNFSADPTDPCVGGTVQFMSIVEGVQNNDLAFYPLLTDTEDATGNNGDAFLRGGVNPPTSGNPLCFNGIPPSLGGEVLITPELDSFDRTNFSLSVEFKLNSYGSSSSNAPEFPVITGRTTRFIGIYVDDTGEVGIKYDNGTSTLSFSSTILSLNQWYQGKIIFANNIARLYIDGTLVHTVNTGPLITSGSDWFTTANFSNGTSLNGCIRNLRIGGGDSENSTDISYDWSFQGGTPSTSTEANPTVTYSQAGNYNVSLTVSNGNTSKTETKNNYITVEDCGPDWPVTPTGDNHIVLVNSDVTLSSSPIAIGDYIGAFYNDNGTLKCAGKAKWTGENLSITVYGDNLQTSEKDGFGVGESFQWKLWKASSNQESYGTATYARPGGIITHMGQFAVNGVSKINSLISDTQPPQTATQTITLQPGWNLISSYIKSNAQDMAAIFESVSQSISIVKNGEGDVYMPEPFINHIGNWNVIDGYKVYVRGSNTIDLTLSGEKAGPSTVITLDEGYNLFAYLKETEQAVQTVTAPIASEVYIIKDALGRTYIPSYNIDHIGNMKPGQGYWAQMSGAATLSYNARMATPPANMHTAQMIPAKYSITRRGTDNATMILDTKGLVAYGDEVGVFDKAGNLVGAATYEDHLMAFSIWGDDPSTDKIDGLEEGAEFEIRVWNKATATEETFAFNANVDMYTTHGMIQVELLRTTNVSTILEANSLKIYPNPTQNDATLSLELTAYASVQATLFDLTGKRVLDIVNENMAAGIHQSKISTDQLPAGLYHCRIIVDGVIHNIPLSVVK